MKIQEKTKLTISDDTLSDPKFIRLSEDYEDVDYSLLKELVVRQETFPIGTHAITLGNIALCKFLYIKPKKDLQISINGGSLIKLRALKTTKMWVEVTSLSITTAEIQEVLLACAGE